MSNAPSVIAGMVYELILAGTLTMSNLEKMMKDRYPGDYSLIMEPDTNKLKMLFDDEYHKTEWMLRWG